MRRFYTILFMTILINGLHAQNPGDQLPEQVGQYRTSELLDFNDETLFEYINGGAEMYLSYGLKGMKGRVYSAENLPDVTIEIYEMTEAKNAFGVFTQTRDKEEYTYGQGSQTHRDAVLFWKDRYFVIVNTMKVTPESEKAVHSLAAQIGKSIVDNGRIPEIVGYLPAEGLATAGYLYFHHYIWLNAYYFIADFNILNINEHTDAVLAKYGTPENRLYLLLVEYPDKETTQKAYTQFKQKFVPEDTDNKAILLEDNKWFMTWMKDNKVGAIFNGETREATEQLYRNVDKKM